MTSGYLSPLVNATILYQPTTIGYNIEEKTFNLQPNVRMYLNRAVKEGKQLCQEMENTNRTYKKESISSLFWWD